MTLVNASVIQTEPAYAWHGEQKIIMNEAGRLALIKALQDKAAQIQAFCHDGEGYDLILIYGEKCIEPYYVFWREEETKKRHAR